MFHTMVKYEDAILCRWFPCFSALGTVVVSTDCERFEKTVETGKTCALSKTKTSYGGLKLILNFKCFA